MKNQIHNLIKKYIKINNTLNKEEININIPKLIEYCINPDPSINIYNNEKLKLSLILDTSYSCFNPLSFSFSFQTLIVLINDILSTKNIVSFDFILSTNTNPVILCSNLNPNKALNSDSILWEALITILSHPSNKSDLASAIKTAFDLQKLSKKEEINCLYILTDGLYGEKSNKIIHKTVSNCVNSEIKVCCIGIGICPIRIEKLFPKVIYSRNPNNLSFIKKSPIKLKNWSIFTNSDEDKIKDYVIDLNNNIDKVINDSISLNYQKIYNQLNEAIIERDAFSLISNKEKEIFFSSDEKLSNPEGDNIELLKKGYLKGQKILVVILCLNDLSLEEKEYISKDYLNTVSPFSNACLKDILDYLGIIIDVVDNYGEAINKLTINDNDYCPYYATWIINGKNNNKDNLEEELMNRFLRILKSFWESGGALIFLAGGGGFYYQVNNFLKIIEFEFNENEIDFYLTDNVINSDQLNKKEYNDKKFLAYDITGELQKNQTFSKQIQYYNNIERLNITHNIFSLYEGTRNCYTNIDNYEQLYPFYPFSRNSEGKINGLFYLFDDEKRGDIFIDCDFRKLFYLLEKNDSIFRYYQNIASWSARPELHIIYDNIEAREWRPIYISEPLENKGTMNSNKLDFFKMKTLFVFDNSGHITGDNTYFNEVKRLLNKYYKKGDKIYLWGSRYVEKTRNEIDKWIERKSGYEGTDPTNIIKILNDCPNHREHLIIVTDGSINENVIYECKKLMIQNDIQLKFVSTYLIGQIPNISFSTPFFRSCQFRNIQVINDKERINLYSFRGFEKPFIDAKVKEIKGISSLHEFNSKYNELCKILSLLKIGLNDKIRQEIKELYIRIKKEFQDKWKNLFNLVQLNIIL